MDLFFPDAAYEEFRDITSSIIIVVAELKFISYTSCESAVADAHLSGVSRTELFEWRWMMAGAGETMSDVSLQTDVSAR